jgi:hypothetical protein
MGLQRPQAVAQVARDVVETDPAQSHHRFFLAARLGDHHDRLFVAQNRSAPRGILALQTDVDRTRQIRALEIRRLAHIDQLRAALAQLQDLGQFERTQRTAERRVKIRPFLPVLDGIVDEIVRRLGLVHRHQPLEVVQTTSAAKHS